jgi:tetratricopeptide (TPR) repeat protein
MRVKSKWLASLLLLVALALSGCSTMSFFRARDFSNKGVKKFSDQKYSDAAYLFDKAIQEDPTFETARMYLAQSYMNQFTPGSTNAKSERMAYKAIETFEYLVNNAKDSEIKTYSMQFIASLYYQLKKPDEAKSWCRKIIEVAPNSESAYYRIALVDYDMVSEKTGNEGEGVKYLTDAEKAAVHAAIDEGLVMLDKALSIKPTYVDAMEYQKLLWYEKAKLETDPKRRDELTLKADELSQKVIVLKRKEMNEERNKAKKVNAGK